MTGVVAVSVTLTVKVAVPAVPVGVPVIAPVEALMVRPAGSAPDAMAKVLVPVPPLAATVTPA